MTDAERLETKMKIKEQNGLDTDAEMYEIFSVLDQNMEPPSDWDVETEKKAEAIFAEYVPDGTGWVGEARFLTDKCRAFMKELLELAESGDHTEFTVKRMGSIYDLYFLLELRLTGILTSNTRECHERPADFPEGAVPIMKETDGLVP